MPTPRRAVRRAPAKLDDEALRELASEAVVRKLGVVGYLRYLRLVAGGRDRFDELRMPLQRLTLDDALAAIRANGED